MTFLTFDALSQQLVQLFQQQQFAEALELVTREGPRFPADRVWADYWRMCAAARVGDRALVSAIAAQALQEGLWYGETLWRQTPSFVPLQGEADFERTVAAHHAAEQQATPPAAALWIEHPAPAKRTAPVLVGLHRNQGTAAIAQPFWQAAVGQGWVVALPQSPQAMFKGAYMWDDLPRAEQTVLEAFATLRTSLDLAPQRTVLGGHSMGGLVALQMALLGTAPVCGFVVNGTAVPFADEPEKLVAALPAARARGLRGYFILGAADPGIPADEIRPFVAQLQAAGIACELEIVPDATHDYHPAFDAALLRGLAFVMA